jgi:NAD+ diphosphatase
LSKDDETMTALTDAYTHCPLCGSPDYAREPRGHRHCRACDHSEFNNPVVAVAALILDPSDRLLLIRRARDPGAGLLAMPGGFVDAGESLEQAIQREIVEEIGLVLTEIGYLCSHPNLYTYRELTRPVCDVFFQARAASFDVILQRDEVSDWTLRSLAEIDPRELAFDSMRHALAVFRAQSEPPSIV